MDKNSFLNGSVDELINNYYRLLLNKSEIKIDKIILFGSYAKDHAKPYSDIDLCIVSSDLEEDKHYDQEMQLKYLTTQIDTMLSPVAYHPKDLENPYDPLAVEIKKFGKEIQKPSID